MLFYVSNSYKKSLLLNIVKMNTLKYGYIFEYWRRKKNLTVPSTVFLPQNSKDKMTSASPASEPIRTSLPVKCALRGLPSRQARFLTSSQDSLQAYRGQALTHICKGHGEASYKRKRHFGVSEIQAHAVIHCKIKIIHLIFRERK